MENPEHHDEPRHEVPTGARMTSSLRIYITLVAGFGLLLLASSIANLLQQPDSQLLLLRAIPWLLLVLAVSRYEIVASGSFSSE